MKIDRVWKTHRARPEAAANVLRHNGGGGSDPEGSDDHVATSGRHGCTRSDRWGVVGGTHVGVRLLALALGVTTPVRSGPNCTDGCVTYPYEDIAGFVPRDYLWIYPALVMVLAFVGLVASIHDFAQGTARLFSRIALSFAVVVATLLATDYVVQLVVVQPSLVNGQPAGLSLWSMYNPHGFFLALEDLGYLLMAVALGFVSAVFTGRSRLERTVRVILLINCFAVIAVLVVLVARSGYGVNDQFEILAISLNWLTLIIVGGLLTGVFAKARRTARRTSTPAP